MTSIDEIRTNNCKYSDRCAAINLKCKFKRYCPVFQLQDENDRLRSENAMLLRQRDPRHKSELDDVEINPRIGGKCSICGIDLGPLYCKLCYDKVHGLEPEELADALKIE